MVARGRVWVGSKNYVGKAERAGSEYEQSRGDQRQDRSGGLDRQVQAKIGQQLRAMYDDVVDQGVPDRFAELLKKLDDTAVCAAGRSGAAFMKPDPATTKTIIGHRAEVARFRDFA